MEIQSLLDTDFYIFNMAYVTYNKFSNIETKYKFKCRNNKKFTDSMMNQIQEEIENLCSLSFNKLELDYLYSLGIYSKSFISYLENFKFKRKYITIDYYINKREFELIIEGPELEIGFYEVPLLAIISNVWCRNSFDKEWVEGNGKKIFKDKLRQLSDFIYWEYKRKNIFPSFNFSDFGTRRRYSFNWQDMILDNLFNNNTISGSSNIYFSYRWNKKPIGTMAHKYFQIFQSIDKLEDSIKNALQTWMDIYRGKNGIALTDILGMDAFLKDFDLYFAKLYDGCRHDSGDPNIWAEKLINHYNNLGINHKTKTAIFSDGLTIEKAIDLYSKWNDKINCSFGIGTNLTNDMGFEPPSIVIKMIECEGKPVAKLSDSKGKNMCENEEYVKYLKKVFDIK